MPSHLSVKRCRTRGLFLGLAAILATGGLSHLIAREGAETESGPAQANAESPHLDKAFDAWLTSAKKPTHRSLAARFITASGGTTDTYEKVLTEWATKIRSKDVPTSARARAELLRTTVFEDSRMQSSVDLTDIENLLPHRIVARKTGYCIGLTVILLDLCERLGWDATAVSAPRHTFLRVAALGGKGSTAVNVETTLSGELHDDDWYRQRFSLGERPATLRPLSSKELGGHLVNNVAYVLLESGSRKEARAMIERSLKLDPNGVEALTNLGVCEARAGNFEKALKAFGRTLELWPGDPVTRLNRVNALLPLGRSKEGLDELESLLKTYPSLSSLRARAHEIRDQFEVHLHWTERQRLTMALVAQEVALRGALPGLEGVYHKGTKLSDPKLRRIDRTLEFQWGRGTAGRGVPRDRFSARWDGWIEIPAEDEYTFLVTCSDGVRIWIDDRPVIDSWRVAGDNFPKGTVPLLAGKHEFRVEYFESIDTAGLLVMLVSEKESDRYDLAPMLFHPGPLAEEPREGSTE